MINKIHFEMMLKKESMIDCSSYTWVLLYNALGMDTKYYLDDLRKSIRCLLLKNAGQQGFMS